MISKLTKILLLVAAICIGIAQAWQHHSQVEYEKSVHAQTIYNLDLKTGKLQTNEPAARFSTIEERPRRDWNAGGPFRSSFIGQRHHPKATA